MTGHITVEHTNGVLTLTLARPEKKNALTNAMYKTLADTIDSAGSNQTIRAILIRGDGDMFTAGNDIAEFVALSTGKNNGIDRHVIRFLHALVSTRLPLVAAVNGHAVGIGTTMLLHCDFILLGQDALLSTPFINLALVPEAGSSLVLPQRIGHLRAFEMFALGEPITAHQALAWGLANRIVSSEDLHAEAFRIASVLAEKPVGSLSQTKSLMRDTQSIIEQMDKERICFLERLSSLEAQEAFTAILQKRSPNFS